MIVSKKHKPYQGKVRKGFSNQTLVTNINGETIQFMGGRTKEQFMVAMYGIVFKIERGDKFDIVQVRCGFKARLRQVIVTDNHARRQILTLKRGQWCIMVCEAKLYRLPNQDNTYRIPKWHFFAHMIQGMYVPKAFDVKKHNLAVENGEEEEHIEPINENEERAINDVINGLFENDKDINLDYNLNDYYDTMKGVDDE